jgi:hypothetical protein
MLIFSILSDQTAVSVAAAISFSLFVNAADMILKILRVVVVV